jgi:hypothetical protein
VNDDDERPCSTVSRTFPFHASNALLGVRIVTSSEEAARVEREIESTLAAWQQILEDRPDRHQAVRVTASLSSGQALCRRGPAGVEIVGGPLLDFNSWKDDRRIWTT